MNFYPSFLKTSKSLIAIVGSVLMVASCQIDDTPTPGIAALSVINAVPDSQPLTFFLDNKQVNSGNFAFGSKIDYLQAYEGTRTAKVMAPNSNGDIVSDTITLHPGLYYSLYIVNKADAAEYLLINDKLNFPAAGKAQVRFINLSPDAPAYDLEIQGDTTNFSNRAFKAYTNFKDVKAKDNATLLLKDKATGETKTTLVDVDIEEGRIYTIWAKGLNNSTETEQQLRIKISQH